MKISFLKTHKNIGIIIICLAAASQIRLQIKAAEYEFVADLLGYQNASYTNLSPDSQYNWGKMTNSYAPMSGILYASFDIDYHRWAIYETDFSLENSSHGGNILYSAVEDEDTIILPRAAQITTGFYEFQPFYGDENGKITS
jgi:hypothetical protein